ncbi:MAG: Zn-dependent hydrolase, partial [Janthinobacterium lividum]
MDIADLRPVAQKLFTEIGALSRDGIGISRDSYGAGETATIQYLQRFAAEHGLAWQLDAAANVHFSSPNDTAGNAAIVIGSHLDSVPQGGNFDGLAGVVAGLLCLIARGDGTPPSASTRSPMRVIGFRGEESAWFGKAYIGSSACFGKLSAEDLALTHRRTGETLASCLEKTGADLALIRSRTPLLHKQHIRAYFELHIEQGPVMVARKLPVGVVPSIRGNLRHNRISCVGEAG